MPGLGLEGAAPGEPERYLSFSPVSAQLPLRQSRRKERQFGMLIFHELTYLQNWAQAAVALRGPGLGLRWEERKKGSLLHRVYMQRSMFKWGAFQAVHIPTKAHEKCKALVLVDCCRMGMGAGETS